MAVNKPASATNLEDKPYVLRLTYRFITPGVGLLHSLSLAVDFAFIECVGGTHGVSDPVFDGDQPGLC